MSASGDNGILPPINNSMNKLCAEIGVAAATRVLVYALPRIQNLNHDLQAMLSAGEREAAAEYAHRGLSSVRAYGTEQLETLLREVNNEDADLQVLQDALAAEFRCVINSVEDWLRRHDTMRCG